MRGTTLLCEFVPDTVPGSFLIAGLMAHTQLFGHVSLELDGQFNDTLTDLDAVFDHVTHVTAESLGLA